VRQFVLNREALAIVRDDMAVLDVQTSGEDVAVTVENAAAISTMLERAGLRHRVLELNLDEIFSAYVAGSDDWVAVPRDGARELQSQQDA
jgi:ABC-2 type transport system ATP-binding protein